MIFDTYLKYRKRKLPLWMSIVLISILSFLVYCRGLSFSVVLVTILFCFSVCYYGEDYWKLATIFIVTGIAISLMTFKSSLFLVTFFKVLAFTHLTFLFAYLCPPTSFKNKPFKICLIFLPYFENQVKLTAQAGEVRGLDLKTKNPFKFIKNGAKLIIPLFVIFTKTMEDVEIALRVKGFFKR